MIWFEGGPQRPPARHQDGKGDLSDESEQDDEKTMKEEEEVIMTELNTQLLTLKEQIRDASPDMRPAFAPQLAGLIATMNEKGIPVPAEIQDLHDDLVNESIEAQFDNMPV